MGKIWPLATLYECTSPKTFANRPEAQRRCNSKLSRVASIMTQGVRKILRWRWLVVWDLRVRRTPGSSRAHVCRLFELQTYSGRPRGLQRAALLSCTPTHGCMLLHNCSIRPDGRYVAEWIWGETLQTTTSYLQLSTTVVRIALQIQRRVNPLSVSGPSQNSTHGNPLALFVGKLTAA